MAAPNIVNVTTITGKSAVVRSDRHQRHAGCRESCI
jgi:hypothetical protein